MAKEKGKRNILGFLENFKKDYEKLQKKYSLPVFKQLNEDFEIERIADHESDMLLREIRKAITEKAVAFLRFVELLLNPTNAPFFMFAIIKNLTPADKKHIEGLYQNLCEFEIKAIALDMEYAEKNEAEFIKYAAKKWSSMHADMRELGNLIETAWHASSEKKERNYFG
ncbi:MAG: hypothetical protein V1660_03315 [archaeon]